MTVKTRFSSQDLERLLSHYNLGSLTHVEPITQGTVQTNYWIETTQGKYVFRYYENRARESVLFESELLTYLKACQYPSPAPMPDQHGTVVGTCLDKPFIIFEFVEGQPVEYPTQAHQSQLIQKVAELHTLTRGYQPQYLAHRLNYDIPHCRQLAALEAEKIGKRDARAKFTWLDAQLAALDLPDRLPKGICHCDFHFSNVLFQDDRFVGLIDFDDANYTYLLFDLVSLVDSWAWPFQSERLDLAQARAIVQAYHAYRPLSAVEQWHIFDVHKLSVLFDCIWFFARGTAEDFYEKRKINFLNNLGREQYAQACSWS